LDCLPEMATAIPRVVVFYMSFSWRTRDTVMVPMSRTLFGCSLALMIFMAIWSGTAVAVTRVDLYSETVEVEARDYAARLKGYQEALARVLVRSTGRRDIANEAGIAGLVKGANRLVLQYRFLEDGRMNVSFDGPVIERFLSSNKLTLWSRERPKTLIWLAMDNGAGARTLVGGEQAAQAKEFLEGLAQVRGMPVVFPIMDSVDMAAVPFVDVWGGFSDKVMQGSERYQPDAVLIGRALRDAAGYWSVRWSLHFDGQVQTFNGTIDDGVQVSADWFARQFAIELDSGPSRVQMHIIGIEDVEQYGRVQAYLRDLSMVRSLRVLQASADDVVFDLTLGSSLQVLRRAMALNRTVVQVSGQAAGQDDTLYYRIGK
jgi:hypothetical protein